LGREAERSRRLSIPARPFVMQTTTYILLKGEAMKSMKTCGAIEVRAEVGP
jgi:hypothetical protein